MDVVRPSLEVVESTGNNRAASPCLRYLGKFSRVTIQSTYFNRIIERITTYACQLFHHNGNDDDASGKRRTKEHCSSQMNDISRENNGAVRED